jgi:Na+/phosphate symporter
MIIGKSTSGLVYEAEKEFISMLEMGYKMFQSASAPILTKLPQNNVEEFNLVDKKINQLHRDIRKKIFEHLTLLPGKDLFTSLVLLSVIDDSERIGDLNKNIVYLLTLTSLDIGAHRHQLNDLIRRTDETFGKTLQVFVNEDETTAASIVQEYTVFAEQCNTVMEMFFNSEGDFVKKDLAAYILLLRLLKRLNAHLKNIASSVVNPFHRIGYKIKNQ